MKAQGWGLNNRQAAWAAAAVVLAASGGFAWVLWVRYGVAVALKGAARFCF